MTTFHRFANLADMIAFAVEHAAKADSLVYVADVVPRKGLTNCLPVARYTWRATSKQFRFDRRNENGQNSY